MQVKMDNKNQSRRQFLKSGALAAVAVPYIIPGSALGKNGAVAPSNRIVMAAIGLGAQGREDLRGFLSKDEVQMIAICDVDKSHAARAKTLVDERNGNSNCKLYSDFRELYAREELDAVMTALPDHWHAIPAIAAAKAGIDVHGQKPFVRTIAEGRALANAVKKYNIVWQTGSQQRSDYRFRYACELVRNGRIGKISHVEVGVGGGEVSPGLNPIQPVPKSLDWGFWLGPAPMVPYRGVSHLSWRHIKDYGCGGLTDWGAHHIDIAHWGLGLEYTGPVEIEGIGSWPTEGLFDVVTNHDIRCTYANGIKMRISNQGLRGGATWYGENGWIHVNRGGYYASTEDILKEVIGPDEIHLYKSKDHKQNFLDCVKSRQQTIAPAEVGHRTVSIALLGEIAMITGRKLDWDPVNEKFNNDPEANRLLERPIRGTWNI
jgi:predicted dehydrogenase